MARPAGSIAMLAFRREIADPCRGVATIELTVH